MREMKPSGVEWIGDIPMDWEVSMIRSLFKIKKDIIGREPEVVLSITQRGLKVKNITENEGQMATSYANYQIVNAGDFAMNHMDLLTGGIGIATVEGVTSPDYRVFRKRNLADCSRYFLYLFESYYRNKIFYAFGQGAANVGRWRLPARNFNTLFIPVPPLSEQQAIVTCLDRKCGQVDALVKNVQAQIEQLKAYKQSLISETVTKGLNPNAPMKDSGVEWIGKIPEGWEVRPLKSLFSFGKGLPITKENLIESGVPVISYGQIHAKWNTGVTTHPELMRFVSESYLETNPASLVKRGDLIMADTSEDREGCGNCAYVDTSEPLFAGYHTIILKSMSQKDNKYLAYSFRTDAWRSQLRKSVSGVKLFSISRRILGTTTVLIPNNADELVAHLDEKCSQIDRLIAVKQAKIEQLEAYKKSLIYEVVTGKIDCE